MRILVGLKITKSEDTGVSVSHDTFDLSQN